MKKQLLILLATFAVSLNAHSLFELRAGYGVNTPSDDTISAGNTMGNMSGLNLDAIVELPMVPVGLGLRYESMGFDIASGANTFETDVTRTSLLINYRIIDLFAYFGIIGTIGIANDLTVKVPNQPDGKYDSDMTYTIGVEGGVSLGLIMLGAELGMSMAKYENTNNFPTEVTTDGIYAKALVGVGF